MSRLPLIVGLGGINAAGRSSAHHAYRRMVIDALPQADAQATWQSLAALMGQKNLDVEFLRGNTLIRKIESSHFDTENIPWNSRLSLSSIRDEKISFITKASQMPPVLPPNWCVTDLADKTVRVDIGGEANFMLPSKRISTVRAAGQLPTGFEPDKLYPSRNHPRGIAMTVYGASDAILSLGIDWDDLAAIVSPDQISVYAGSGMSQLDANSNGGMMMSRLNGKRVSSKHCPFGFAEMPADFINAYILGSIGNTGTSMGACASFLYNLRNGLMDIQTGKARIVIVGNSEAPIVPEIIEGYSAMGALATDVALMKLDGIDNINEVDHRRASRPFSNNCGFTIAESAQFIVLMDDELAMETGATIYGAVSDVFVNADGFKKSIAAPGVGNYVTVAKAVAAARSIVGDESIQQRSFIQAHGTSTPQNRVTESHILNETAKTFGIKSWPVAAVKSYLGHSIGAAAGDQILGTLGVWQYGFIPGIHSIDHIADDVSHDALRLSAEHLEVGKEGMDVALINAKGFGGNNATANLLAPHIVERMLLKKYGRKVFNQAKDKNLQVAEKSAHYDQRACKAEVMPIYKFDHQVLDGSDVHMTRDKLSLTGFEQAIDLAIKSPYSDML